MKTPSLRMRRTVSLSAVPLAVLLAGGLVWQGSQAAFTDDTSNDNNVWSAGSMDLIDDDNGVAAFNIYSIVPTQRGQRCIVVTSYANHPSEVRPYVRNLTSTKNEPTDTALEDHLFLDLVQGDGGSFGDCEGFAADAATATGFGAAGRQPISVLNRDHSSFDSGGAVWQTTGDIQTTGEKRTYKITWEFDTDGLTQEQVNSLQKGTVGAELVWEIHSSDHPNP
ncbi:hypothetical protein [uncultured Arthrobacter sp.]|uniref:hypothetical protein n=1 Tax=uncultured Arthrobacter sp. TaxID=114050 RepID=UPI002629078B|nr:hypothetical protein [uncultured Arthrobacter sp.]